ncbi:hypothetical protein [Cuneatibacter caecimuris]|nr:hypothetical protein [Cuneatibacter caecimuris]
MKEMETIIPKENKPEAEEMLELLKSVNSQKEKEMQIFIHGMKFQELISSTDTRKAG